MTVVLDAIGEELIRSALSRRRRRRRHRVVAASTCGVALMTGAAVAAITETNPLAHMPLLSQMTPGDDGLHALDVRAGGRTWQLTAYRSKEEYLCVTFSPAGQEAEGVGCRSGFALASNFVKNRAPVSYAVHAVPAESGATLVVTGVMSEAVRAVEAEVPDVVSVVATVSDDRVDVPVDVDQRSLTPEGRRMAMHFPDKLTVRLYAAVLNLRAPTNDLTLNVRTDARERAVRVPPGVMP